MAGTRTMQCTRARVHAKVVTAVHLAATSCAQLVSHSGPPLPPPPPAAAAAGGLPLLGHALRAHASEPATMQASSTVAGGRANSVNSARPGHVPPISAARPTASSRDSKPLVPGQCSGPGLHRRSWGAMCSASLQVKCAMSGASAAVREVLHSEMAVIGVGSAQESSVTLGRAAHSKTRSSSHTHRVSPAPIHPARNTSATSPMLMTCVAPAAAKRAGNAV